MHYDTLPFERGSTYFGGGTVVTGGGDHLLGKEYLAVDDDRHNGTKKLVRLRVVKNGAAAAVVGKRLARFSTTAGEFENVIDGYATVTAHRSYPIDQNLVSCPVGDYCYVVVDGPALCKTDLAGADNNVINVGDNLWSLTAASSGSTTAGRVYVAALTGATSVLGLGVLNVIGRALSAKTTANTNADVLVSVGRY